MQFGQRERVIEYIGIRERFEDGAFERGYSRRRKRWGDYGQGQEKGPLGGGRLTVRGEAGRERLSERQA